MADLFSSNAPQRKSSDQENKYTASEIEVLEGLEPVRHRPGMYIGGTDENAMHHLVSEVFDNSMDEAVAGYATYISLQMHKDFSITVSDNGRGIPVDPHPRFPDKSALEVILTTLHSGGKFSGKVYYTSGGLHGVGISVVNALSEKIVVTVRRDGKIFKQEYSKGNPVTELEVVGETKKKDTGTSITFYPDMSIFDDGIKFRPARLYNQAKSKAYLFKGVEIRWKCDEELLTANSKTPAEDTIHFPNGIADYLSASIGENDVVTAEPFAGEVNFPEKKGKIEWAVHWAYLRDVKVSSFCNTVPTPQGGTHETGLKNVLLKGIKDFAELVGVKKASLITADDAFNHIHGIISIFIPEPQFQGQTKDKLSNREVIRLVEANVKDRFDLWLTDNKTMAKELLDFIIERTEERLNRKQSREIVRKSAVQKLRLPGKLADCSQQNSEGTEIFLVEGDSAGGSAKMARNRKTQAILPLRGKILNVASATKDKIMANQEIQDMNLAFGCGIGDGYSQNDLRYEKVIIMTDADVDGAHIASLLMTYFFKFMPDLIRQGHLYLAQPPLFRIKQGTESFYVVSEVEKDEVVARLSKGRGNIDVGRFKGLGEMTPAQLKETTMNPENRILHKVIINDENHQLATTRVEELMGKKPELRFKFITEQSALMSDEFKEQLDV